MSTERNARVAARYDELMREGKHGHYETLFRVVREEVERLRAVIQTVLPDDPVHYDERDQLLADALQPNATKEQG